mmetsp:Transcript_29768/g.74853  ORF Transcript_29768/g.74853 Transcript_29768/m.74853 type:complete len:221 (-) Transcript_29768:634-1296(-)
MQYHNHHEKGKETTMIALADTAIEPPAVVVEDCNAAVTTSAVLGTRNADLIAAETEQERASTSVGSDKADWCAFSRCKEDHPHKPQQEGHVHHEEEQVQLRVVFRKLAACKVDHPREQITAPEEAHIKVVALAASGESGRTLLEQKELQRRQQHYRHQEGTMFEDEHHGRHEQHRHRAQEQVVGGTARLLKPRPVLQQIPQYHDVVPSGDCLQVHQHIAG